jgi:hypothetical protein
MEVDLNKIPVLRWSPRRITVRYNRETRRLHVWGSDRNLDMNSIGSMIGCGHFRHGVDAVIHTAPSGVISIYRGHRLAELIRYYTLDPTTQESCQ